MFRNVFSGCVSDRSSQAEVLRTQKLKFGASLSSALKHGYLPGPLVDILVYIAKEGVATADVFRRPGNPNDTRRIVKRLTEGKQVIYSNYSFYTLASVVKKFLLKTPGGVFTPGGEEQLLHVLTVQNKADQIDGVRKFIETLMPAHQQLVALLFGTWFRIVTYSEVNCMSVEALSRSVAGSMFHTCAEDPAKVEKASRMMQFLIDNYGVEGMFGQENIRYFTETTHTAIHIRELYHYSCCPESEFIPLVQSDVIEMTRMDHADDDDEAEDGGFLGRDREYGGGSLQVSPTVMRHSDISDDSQININISTLSAPEVSFVPSPEVSKRPKSLEDNLNEVRSHYQSRCLSRFNSVKRKQLERLRQRSDWFLSPSVRERNNSRKGRADRSHFFSGSSTSGGQGDDCDDQEICDSNKNSSQHHYRHHHHHHHNNGHKNHHHQYHHNGSTNALHYQKNSGNSVVVVTKASSEGAVLDVFSDGDSVFTDNTSRSESPASEPVWSHVLKGAHSSRDIIHSDTVGQLALPECEGLHEGSSGFDLSIASHEELSCLLPEAGGMMQSTDLSSPCRFISYDDDKGGISPVKDSKEDDEEDDDDNTTPTGGQEEEENTIMASLPDITQQSTSEDSSSTHNEDLDKESPTTQQSEEMGVRGAEIGDNNCKPSSVSLSTSSAVHSAAISGERAANVVSSSSSMQGQQKDSYVSEGNESGCETQRREEQEGEIVKCFLVEREYCAGDDKGGEDS